MRHTAHPSRRGLTLVELLVITLVIAAVMVILLPSTGRRYRGGDRQIKDSFQIRGVHQSLVLFAQNNKDLYPIPSQLDRAHTTLTNESAKDDPGSIYSILVYNGFFNPELLVSPAEHAPYLAVMDNYALSSPPNAADPAQALWDPSLRGSSAEPGFARATGGDGIKPVGALPPGSRQSVTYANGNASYALMPFFGNRLSRWTPNFDASQALVGNRGPAYAVTLDKSAPISTLVRDTNTTPGFHADTAKGSSSITLGIHGSRNKWEGNIAYNDNHVTFETRPDPENNPWNFTGTGPIHTNNSQPDNLFVSEDDYTIVGDSYPAAATTSMHGLADTHTLTGPNPLRNTNNFLKTWVVQSVGPRTTPTGDSYATTDAITFVID
ncbi:MAG: type II secretion system protein [Phycisphaerae bacterium]|jgi:type II secretory pathway pseudopilin PulG